MSKPTNSADRNQMTEWERQCYDWGWEDAEERIIKLLERDLDVLPEFARAIELIKGEQK